MQKRKKRKISTDKLICSYRAVHSEKNSLTDLIAVLNDRMLNKILQRDMNKNSKTRKIH